jgi:hypothetical protein
MKAIKFRPPRLRTILTRNKKNGKRGTDYEVRGPPKAFKGCPGLLSAPLG